MTPGFPHGRRGRWRLAEAPRGAGSPPSPVGAPSFGTLRSGFEGSASVAGAVALQGSRVGPPGGRLGRPDFLGREVLLSTPTSRCGTDHVRRQRSRTSADTHSGFRAMSPCCLLGFFPNMGARDEGHFLGPRQGFLCCCCFT